MQCCGDEVTTPCCPICGKSMPRGPLDELLQHVANQAAKQHKAMESYTDHWKRMGGQTGGVSANQAARVGRRLEQARANVERWERWRDALRKVVEDQDCPVDGL